jgi:hypothetical protein
MNTTETTLARPTTDTESLVVVVAAPFETTTSCSAADAGSLLHPAPMETKRIHVGIYPVTTERCACGELEATVTFRARLVSRTTGPLWRRRTMATSETIETTDVVTGPAEPIHDGLVIQTDDDGRPVAWFATAIDPQH